MSALAGAAAQAADGPGGVANSIHISQAVTPHLDPQAESGDDGERVEAEWRVVVVTGQVRSQVSGGDWLPVAEGRIIGRRTRIETGEDGQLLLFNGRDSIAVSPGTSLVLSDGQQTPGMMSVTQESGTARYDVESRRSSGSWQRDLVDTGRPRASDAPSADRFEVETPYLAAIVKGTTFSVSVARNQASVSVHEGLVEVRDSRSGASRDVEAGRTGTVGRRSGVRVTDSTPGPAAGHPPSGLGGGQGGNQDAGEDGVDEEGADDDFDDDDGDDRDAEDGDDDDGDDRDAEDGDDDDGDDQDADDGDDEEVGRLDGDSVNDRGRTSGKGTGRGRKTGQGREEELAAIGCNVVGGCGGDRS